MKKCLLFFVFICFVLFGYTQSGTSIQTEGTDSILFFNNNVKSAALSNTGSFRLGTIEAFQTTALFQLNSSSQGFLAPRMSATDRGNIVAPATGLLIYNTSTNQFDYYNGSAWQIMFANASGGAWDLAGNAGTTNGTDFIGTTDAQDLDVRTNNVIHHRFTQQGQIEFLNTGTSVFIGESAGEDCSLSGSENVFVGYESGFKTTNGLANIAIGYRSLYSNIGGDFNTAIGYSALYSNTTGNQNTVSGLEALYSNTTGHRNTAYGRRALYRNVAGANATAIGTRAMEYANNTATAFTNYNVAVGYEALRGSTTAADNTGNSNTALGYQSLMNYTSGGNNTAIGYNAGDIITEGTNNTFVGYNADATANNLTNATAIGANASVAESNSLILGNGANVGIGVSTPSEKLELTGNLLIRNPQNNGALIFSPSNSEYGVDPDFVIQSAETGAGNNTNFHLSRNAMYRTSDNSYQYIDDAGVSATKFEYTSGGDLKFSYAAAGTGAITWTDNAIIKGSTGNVGIGTTAPAKQLSIGGINDQGWIYMDSDDEFIIENNQQSNRILLSDGTGGLRFEYDGTETMRIKNNVGIGLTNPSEKLEVNGNVEIPAANDYKYADPKTRYASVHANGFTLKDLSSGAGVYASGGSNSTYILGGFPTVVDYLTAAIQLPHGATITDLTFKVYDADATYNCYGELRYITGSGGNGTIVATTGISTSGGVQTITTNNITEPVVNNSTRLYYLRFVTRRATSDLRLYGAIVTYTVGAAD